MSVDGKLREITCVCDTWLLLKLYLFSLVVCVKSGGVWISTQIKCCNKLALPQSVVGMLAKVIAHDSVAITVPPSKIRS
jgi:hypothetical protein